MEDGREAKSINKWVKGVEKWKEVEEVMQKCFAEVLGQEREGNTY